MKFVLQRVSDPTNVIRNSHMLFPLFTYGIFINDEFEAFWVRIKNGRVREHVREPSTWRRRNELYYCRRIIPRLVHIYSKVIEQILRVASFGTHQPRHGHVYNICMEVRACVCRFTSVVAEANSPLSSILVTCLVSRYHLLKSRFHRDLKLFSFSLPPSRRWQSRRI